MSRGRRWSWISPCRALRRRAGRCRPHARMRWLQGWRKAGGKSHPLRRHRGLRKMEWRRVVGIADRWESRAGGGSAAPGGIVGAAAFGKGGGGILLEDPARADIRWPCHHRLCLRGGRALPNSDAGPYTHTASPYFNSRTQQHPCSLRHPDPTHPYSGPAADSSARQLWDKPRSWRGRAPSDLLWRMGSLGHGSRGSVVHLAGG
jgi:hypothetical protein